MQKIISNIFSLAVISSLFLISLNSVFPEKGECLMSQYDDKDIINLPKPDRTGSASFEQTIASRRSIRDFSGRRLSIEQISQLLWAAQGTTSSHGFRSAPSAGALYPLEVYVVSGSNNGLDAGFYHYNSKNHRLIKISAADLRADFCKAALSQSAVNKAPVTLLITGVFKRTTVKYGQRGFQYVYMEAGHAGQNILLQAEALGLDAVPIIGAFQDKAVIRMMELTAEEQPLYLIPVGYGTDR